MKLATRWYWLRGSVVVFGLVVAGGLALSGCSPAPEPTSTGGGTDVGVPSGPTSPEEAVTEEGEPESEAGDVSPVPEEAASTEAESQPEAAELSLDPAVSTYAPAEDLVAQVQSYLEELEEAVQTEEEYNDSVEKIAKESNTLILIALALGLHDSDNQLKSSAPGILKAAQQLAAAGDFAAAKAGVEAVKGATTSAQGDAAELKWEKVASLPELMEAVPLINTKLKRYVRDGREERMKEATDELAGCSAVLAIIAQGSLANSEDTDKPDEVDQWHRFCVQMRDAAAAVNAGVREYGKEGTPAAFEAAKAAMQDLAQSCDDCHEVFHPDAVIE